MKINRKGNSFVPILVCVAIVGASVAAFFVYTKKKVGNDQPEENPEVAEVDPTNPPVTPVVPGPSDPSNPGPSDPSNPGTPKIKPGDPNNPANPGTPTTPEGPDKPQPDPPSVVAGLRFETSGALAAKIGGQILAGDFAGAAALISGEEPGSPQFDHAGAALDLIFKERKLKADPKGFGEIGQIDTAHRFGLNLSSSEGEEAGRIVMDLVRDEKRGWKVGTMEVPKEIAAALPKPPGPGVADPTDPSDPDPVDPANPKPVSPLIVEERPEDALAAAESFVASLLKQEYDAARQTADFKRVSSEKIAGLCIVFEEGGYKMRITKPLITTASQANSAWVIARLEHSAGGSSAEFGIELEKEGDEWKVVALNLSKLLATFAEERSTKGVAYAPMVANPEGGQSIALYFEFDDASIHPRAARQLDIVSRVLKGDSSKSLKITGHTDELGEEDYNIKLSKDRAANVKERLLDLGVNVAQIVTIGAGESSPLKPNSKEDGTDDPEARSHNRRAEIFLDF